MCGPFLTLGCSGGCSDGRDKLFWAEPWLDERGVLLDEGSLTILDINARVTDFVTASGQWEVSKLSGCLPTPWVKRVVGMTPPGPHLG